MPNSDSRIWIPDGSCIPFVLEQGFTGTASHILFSFYLDDHWKGAICGACSIGQPSSSPNIEFLHFGIFKSRQVINGTTWLPNIETNSYEIPITGGGLKNTKIHENIVDDRNVKGLIVGRAAFPRSGPFYRIILEGGNYYAIAILGGLSTLGQLSIWGYSFPMIPNEHK